MISFYRFDRKKNRSSLDIVQNILIVASASEKKTRIMYRANLSYLQINKYLRTLLEQGLLEKDNNSQYLISNKGIVFLDLYNDYVERLNQLKEQTEKCEKNKRFLKKMCFGTRH